MNKNGFKQNHAQKNLNKIAIINYINAKQSECPIKLLRTMRIHSPVLLFCLSPLWHRQQQTLHIFCDKKGQLNTNNDKLKLHI